MKETTTLIYELLDLIEKQSAVIKWYGEMLNKKIKERDL